MGSTAGMLSALILCLLSCFYLVESQDHFVPDASLEFLKPSGLRISLPDWNPNVRQVAYHININAEFTGVEHGQYAADVTRKRSGRWSWVVPEVKVKQGDTVHYWINVILENNQGFNALNREYKVRQNNPHSGDGSTTPTTQPCTMSQSSVNGRSSLCQGEVLLDQHFNSLDGWSHQVSIGGDAPDDEFTIFMKEPFASWIERGRLFIKPSLLEDKYNDTFVRSGELLLPGCTSYVTEQCHKRANSYVLLPPIISARLTSQDKFSFRYGIVEIRAKFPQGKWIVPELWLEPVNGQISERVVVGLSRGNADDSEFGWHSLEAGVLGDSQSSLGKKTQDSPWARDFHTFKLLWTPDQMQFFVDNQEIHKVSSYGFPIVNKEVFITLGVHVGGMRDFPDSIPDKPWKNSNPKPSVWKYDSYVIETYSAMERFLRFWDAKSSWYPSWAQDSALQVESIRITAI